MNKESKGVMSVASGRESTGANVASSAVALRLSAYLEAMGYSPSRQSEVIAELLQSNGRQLPTFASALQNLHARLAVQGAGTGHPESGIRASAPERVRRWMAAGAPVGTGSGHASLRPFPAFRRITMTPQAAPVRKQSGFWRMIRRHAFG